MRALWVGGLLATLVTAAFASESTDTPLPGVDRVGPRLSMASDAAETLERYLTAEFQFQRGERKPGAVAMLALAKRARDARIARRATEMNILAGDYKEAAAAATLWIELEPGSVVAAEHFALLLAQTSTAEETGRELASILAKLDDPGTLFSRLPTVFSRYSDRTQALKIVRELAERYPRLAEASFAVAIVANTAKESELAVAQARKALELKPDWGQAAILLAELQGRGASDEALGVYRTFLEKNSESHDVRAALARALVQRKDYRGAAAEFQRLAARPGDNGESAFAWGLTAMQLADWPQAVQGFTLAIDRNYREDDTARFNLGLSLENLKRYNEAINAFESVDSGEQMFASRMRSATLRGRVSGVKAGLDYLKTVNPESSADEVLYVQTEAQLLRDAKRYSDAFDVIDRAARANADQPELLYDRAMAAEKLGKLDLLERDLRRLMELKPDHAHAYNALGFTLADRNVRLDEAKTLIERAIQLSPDDPFIMDSLGWVLYRQGKLKESRDVLDKAYRMRPDPEIAAHLSEVLHALGERSAAVALLKSALVENPDHEALKDALGRIKQ